MLTEIPTLRTPRLTLRGFCASDLDDYAALNADPRFRDPLGGEIYSRARSWAAMESAMGQWALRGHGLFAVEHDGRCIGRVGILHPSDWPEPELAWGIGADWWGRGLATEAARAVLDWGFGPRGMTRLVSFILPVNQRSRRVAEKLGAVRDGVIEVRGLTADLWVHAPPGGGMLA